MKSKIQRNKSRPAVGERGVFVTLSTLFIALLLISVAYFEGAVTNGANTSFNGILASQSAASLKVSSASILSSIYSNVGGVTFSSDFNSFNFRESFPNLSQRNNISGAVSKVNSLFSSKFNGAVSINLGLIDAGKIQVWGKDFNVVHSLTNGFSDNTIVRYNYGARKFSTIFYDVNVTSDMNVSSTSLPLCVSCANPVRLKVRVWSQNGTLKVNFDNSIDALQSGSIIMTTGALGSANDLNFTYAVGNLTWKSASRVVNLDSNVYFIDSVVSAGVNDDAIVISPSIGGYK